MQDSYSNDNDCALSTHGLSVGYKRRSVASNIDIRLQRGTLTCLIGANGCGKTTLLRTLCGFIPPVEGCVSVADSTAGGKRKDICRMSGDRRARLIGVVLTDNIGTANITVRETVALGRSPYTGYWGTLGDDDLRIVERSMAAVGINSLADRSIQTLSDGERQKTMIAKALAQQTPIMILDEPTAFLDYPGKVEIMRLLVRLAHENNKTIILSTHDLEIVLQTADMLMLMNNGLLTTGTPRSLADDGSIAAFINRQGIAFHPATLTIEVG